MLLHVSFAYQLEDGIHVQSGSFIYDKCTDTTDAGLTIWYSKLINEIIRAIITRFSLPEDVAVNLLSINKLVEI